MKNILQNIQLKLEEEKESSNFEVWSFFGQYQLNLFWKSWEIGEICWHTTAKSQHNQFKEKTHIKIWCKRIIQFYLPNAWNFGICAPFNPYSTIILEAQWAEPVSLTFHSALRKLNTEPSMGASHEISVHLAKQFQRRSI